MNLKNKRIAKLHRRGLTVQQIARKLGYGNPPSSEGIQRVLQYLDTNLDSQ